jgi:undecaprenyl-diphosphatase
MQLAIMEFFQRIASPSLDLLVEFMTMLGEETVFILAISWFLWCASKRRGFAMFSSLFTALIGMSVLKAVVKAPRPFQVIPEIEGKRVATATGYSFPSGHTTGAASFYSALAVSYKRRWLSLLCAIAILLVGLSRMYLGVHWPLDVFAGLALGITVTFATHDWFLRLYDIPKRLFIFSFIVGSASAVIALYLGVSISWGITDPVGFEDPMKLFALAGGGYLGFAWDQRKISYTTDGTVALKILRYLFGVAVLMGIQALKALPGDSIAVDLLRYLLTGLWATALYPLIGSRIKIGKTGKLFTRA